MGPELPEYRGSGAKEVGDPCLASLLCVNPVFDRLHHPTTQQILGVVLHRLAAPEERVQLGYTLWVQISQLPHRHGHTVAEATVFCLQVLPVATAIGLESSGLLLSADVISSLFPLQVCKGTDLEA